MPGQGPKGAEESESDFESDPPSPKSSEEEEEQDEEPEEEGGLQGEPGDFNDDDTEPENLGHRPLLMDSEDEEEEEKHSSDSDDEPAKAAASAASPSRRAAAGSGPGRDPGGPRLAPARPPSAAGPAAAQPEVDVFGAVPFFSARAPQPRQGERAQAPCPRGQPGPAAPVEPEEFDVFTKAPFGRKGTGPEAHGLRAGAASVDVFGSTPFQPFAAAASRSGSSEDLFGLVPFEEIAGSQQPRGKPRSLQKLTSRQRRPKQDAAKSNGKRHHGPAGGAKKPAKPAYRTPERARRHRRAGRRDSQSSSEFLTVSDSKENISVALPDGLPAEDSLLDPFGAKPFHPADLPWHPPHQGLGDSNPVLPGRPRPGSLHGAFHGAEALKMDDFGAVPFTELVVQGLGSQQPQQPQPGDLDPFGAAPFPSKQ